MLLDGAKDEVKIETGEGDDSGTATHGSEDEHGKAVDVEHGKETQDHLALAASTQAPGGK